MDGSALELEKSKFNAIISSIREGVVLLNPEQKVIGANERASDFTGYQTHEMLGKSVSDVLYMIDAEDKLVDPNLLCPTGGLDMDGVIYKACVYN